MGEPNITDLPPTSKTVANWGSHIDNPTSVSTNERHGPMINPGNHEGSLETHNEASGWESMLSANS